MGKYSIYHLGFGDLTMILFNTWTRYLVVVLIIAKEEVGSEMICVKMVIKILN